MDYFTRRRFLGTATAAIAGRRLLAQTLPSNVAGVERTHILIEAPAAMAAQPQSLHALSVTIATLTAAFLLTQKGAYAERVGELLTASLIAPATRRTTQPTQDIVELIPFAEIAVAVRFLVDFLPVDALTAFSGFFSELLDWLNTAHAFVIARDTKDHRASAWLLVVSALARSCRNDTVLDQCRHRLRIPTLRNQIAPDGSFPQEMATPNPMRNTLLNFDLLTATCQLLSSPLDDLWHDELIDGVGLRNMVAWIYPILADRAKWPGVSDEEGFREVPLRRPGLLFTGRAFNRPEYIDLFLSIPTAVPVSSAASLPIRQPLLWITRANHGL